VPKSRELWAGVAAGRLNQSDQRRVGALVSQAVRRLAQALSAATPRRAGAVALTDWCAELLSHLSDAQVQQMLGAEQGGMNEVLADVYGLTGDRK
jgi:hypothetical protein